MAKNELISLALLTITPLHAYAISAVVDEMGIEQWAQVSRASLYSALSRLEKRGAIAVHTEKVDNMPERKVYSITAEGSALFHEELRDAIVSVNKSDGMLFHLAVNFFVGTSAEEGVEWAKQRKDALDCGAVHVQAQYEMLVKESCEPALISLRAAKKSIAAEIVATEEFITLLEQRPDYYQQYAQQFKDQVQRKGAP